jgi:hypothetical protein
MFFHTGSITLYGPWPSLLFLTISFSGVVLLALRPNPNLGDQELHFVWPLPFDLSDMGSSTKSLHPL